MPATNDTDAQAFITAASISNSTQESAINTLVTSLKSAGVWTKAKAIYPIVGGSAAAHKFNLKNPVDSDAAFRIVWGGVLTHGANGVTSGSGGYGATKLIASTSLSLTSASLFVAGSYAISARAAAVDDGSNSYFLIAPVISGSLYARAFGTSPGQVAVANTDTVGVFGLSRTANNLLKAYKAGTSIGSDVATFTGNLPTKELYLLAENANGSVGSAVAGSRMTFAFVGDGLTDAEVTSLTNAINTFNSALSR